MARLSRPRKGFDACDTNPAHDDGSDEQSEFPGDADDGRADGDGVDVVDGTRVLGGQGEGLHWGFEQADGCLCFWDNGLIAVTSSIFRFLSSDEGKIKIKFIKTIKAGNVVVMEVEIPIAHRPPSELVIM